MEEMNTFLSWSYTREEVEGALKKMGPPKSLGPNGFGACFYQKYWKIVDDHVSFALLSILRGEGMFSSLNSTLITLIPKKSKPNCVNEFRPISCCNMVYKFVSKVITNKLKPIMHSHISTDQNALLFGWLVTDNIMIAHELLHTLKHNTKGKKWKMTLKLDMSKAYDRVEWKNLEVAMEALGFNEQWRSLLMSCVFTVTYSVIVNGKVGRSFQPTWGLRQGDHLSPYLFFICAEGLSDLINKTEKMWHHGALSNTYRARLLTIHYLLTIVFFFCQAMKEDWEKLRSILGTYERGPIKWLKNKSPPYILVPTYQKYKAKYTPRSRWGCVWKLWYMS